MNNAMSFDNHSIEVLGRLRAIHVIAGLDAVHGGPSYSVPRLCEALATMGVQTTLLSVVGLGVSQSDAVDRGYRDCRFSWDYARVPLLRGLRKSSGLMAALREIVPKVNVVHNHGLWLMPNILAGRETARAQIPLIVSPRGMLSPAALAYSRRKKRAVWWLLQGPALRHAACIHATSEQEYQEVRAFGLINPAAIIPNGVDVPESSAKSNASTTAGRIVLSLSRVHPKKGLDRLLRAWGMIEGGHPDWWLRIVGPGENGYENELQSLAAALGLTRVSIEEPIFGDAKRGAYRDADFFVLPTLNENFGLTVAESLAAGTPVISTKGAPWSGLEAEGCGWWIDHGVESLAAALTTAMAMPRETLKTMGAKGRAWMERDFSWNRVARDMIDVYRWLAGGAEAPPTVRFH